MDSSLFWPLRLLRGMFNMFNRRSNTLDTLYRPHKLNKPYVRRRDRDQTSSASLVNTQKEDKYFGSNNWRPVTNPNLVGRKDRADKVVNVTNDTNYWKLLPDFVTSSGKKLRTYFWRNFPRILNRSSNGSKLRLKHLLITSTFSGARLLGARQARTSRLGRLGGQTGESTKSIRQN